MTSFWCFWHQNDAVLESYLTKRDLLSWLRHCNLQAPAPTLPHSPVVDVPSATPRDPADGLQQQRHSHRSRRRPTTPREILDTKGSFPPLLPPSMHPCRNTKRDPSAAHDTHTGSCPSLSSARRRRIPAATPPTMTCDKRDPAGDPRHPHGYRLRWKAPLLSQLVARPGLGVCPQWVVDLLCSYANMLYIRLLFNMFIDNNNLRWWVMWKEAMPSDLINCRWWC